MASPVPVRPLSSAMPQSASFTAMSGQPRRWARPLVPIMPFQRDEVQWLDPPFWGAPDLPVAEPSSSSSGSGAASASAEVRTQPAAEERESQSEASSASHDEKGKSPQAQESTVTGGNLKGGKAEVRLLSQEELKSLVSSSISSPLTPDELQDLLLGISSDVGFKCLKQQLNPSQFPELVNQNPSVATELLLRLQTPGPLQSLKEYALYEIELMRMEKSLQSIEVANRILSAMESPMDFVLEYISRSIASCNDVKDKAAQSRQVRLLCMFIQAQLRNKTVHVQDVFIEVQAFCIEFSRIKEAAALFKLLKSLDNE